MSILLDERTTIIIQDITGRQAANLTREGIGCILLRAVGGETSCRIGRAA